MLVDRLWLRGISKAELRIDTWVLDLAPTDELRQWFGHDPTRWDDFGDRFGASPSGCLMVVRAVISSIILANDQNLPSDCAC